MDRKDVKLKLKALDEDGTFEGYAAVFGNLDRSGEIIAPSAFDRTLKARNGEPVPVLWQHADPAGSGALSLTRSGLYIKGKLLLSTRTGAEAYEFIKAGVVKGMSIGYRVVSDVWEDSVRTLKEIELYEVSLVTIPANPEAAVLAVKDCEDCAHCKEQDDDPQAPPQQAPASKASDPVDDHSLAVVARVLALSMEATKELLEP